MKNPQETSPGSTCRPSLLKKGLARGSVRSAEDIYGQIAKPENSACCCTPSENCCDASSESQSSSSLTGCSAQDLEKESLSSNTREAQTLPKVLNVDLLVIDLNVCRRCVPTGDRLRSAVNLLTPIAEALEIDLRYREIVAQTPAEAKEYALLTSPTIRLNGRDIAQDIRESVCESCGGPYRK